MSELDYRAMQEASRILRKTRYNKIISRIQQIGDKETPEAIKELRALQNQLDKIIKEQKIESYYANIKNNS